jgi:hypothetical protein
MSDSHHQRNDPVEFPRTTWARATAGYDDDFRRRHLVAEVVTAIADASLVTEANCRGHREANQTRGR